MGLNLSFVNKKIRDYAFDPCGYDDGSEEYEYVKLLGKGWKRRSVKSTKLDLKTEYWVNGLNSKVITNIDTAEIKKFRVSHDKIHGVNVLFCFHGNGETSINSLHYLKPLVREIINDYLIVLVEYPYYGNNITSNKRRPTEEECYDASYMVYMDTLKLLSKQNLSIRSINLFGRSIGTGIASWMSTVCDYVDRVILIHPFMSIVEVPLTIQRRWNSSNSMNIVLDSYNMFDTFTAIEYSNAKQFLIVHAENDPLINVDHSIQIYKKLNFVLKIPTHLIIVPNGGHDCDFLLPKEYFMNTNNSVKSKNLLNNPHCKKEIKFSFARILLPNGDEKYCGDIVGLPSLSCTSFKNIKEFLLN